MEKTASLHPFSMAFIQTDQSTHDLQIPRVYSFNQ